jgi:hypothetical protein
LVSHLTIRRGIKEEFEDTKGVIRIRISKNNRRHKVQKTKQKTKTTINKTYTSSYKSSNTNPTKNRGELMCAGRVGSSCSTSNTRCVTLVTIQVISQQCD